VLAQEDVTTLSAPGTVLWPLTDHLGTVRDVINSQGQVRNHLAYDAFGKVVSETNAAVDFLFGYTGRERDEETGLHYYRARYYDPAVGRFVSEDPIGFEAGDANLYRYVGNEATGKTDPSGMVDKYDQLPWESAVDWIERVRQFDPAYARILQEATEWQEAERTGVLPHMKEWDAIAERNADTFSSRALAGTAGCVEWAFHAPTNLAAMSLGTDREGLKDAIGVMSYYSNPGAYYSRMEIYNGADAARAAELQGYDPRSDPHRILYEASLTGVDIYVLGGIVQLGAEGLPLIPRAAEPLTTGTSRWMLLRHGGWIQTTFRGTKGDVILTGRACAEGSTLHIRYAGIKEEGGSVFEALTYVKARAQQAGFTRLRISGIRQTGVRQGAYDKTFDLW
jgi:RHS repeat-associated protein